MAVYIKNLSIIGCGQIGTSILLAMAQQEKTLPTTIYDPSDDTEELVRKQFAAQGFDTSHLTFSSSIAEAVAPNKEKHFSGADLIILATPMSAFESVAAEIAEHAKVDAILTDTGSAKKVSIENIRRAIDGEMHIHYVPAHPGNGSQGAGPLTGSAGNILGKNSTMFLISDEGEQHTPPPYYPEGVVQNFWNDVGVTTAFITTEKHDKFFGQCSHFQHALVFGLMGTAANNPAILHNFQHAGTALRNLSRVAISQLKEGEPSALVQMWLPIFQQNGGPIGEAHKRFQHHFSDFMGHVSKLKTDPSEDGQIDEEFVQFKSKLEFAKTFRDKFDDPERRETIEGDRHDLTLVPEFNPTQKGSLTSTYNAASLSALSTNLLLPIAISYAQLMSAHDIDPEFVKVKANPSFRDGTHPSTYDADHTLKLLKGGKDDLVKLANSYDQHVTSLMDAIRDNNLEHVVETILTAQLTRVAMPGPRKGDAVRSEYERALE